MFLKWSAMASHRGRQLLHRALIVAALCGLPTATARSCDAKTCFECIAETSSLGDCHWCNNENSCHDKGSVLPLSCANPNGLDCVSDSFNSGCHGNCSGIQTIPKFNPAKLGCLAAICNAAYCTPNDTTGCGDVKDLPKYLGPLGVTLNTSFFNASTDVAAILVDSRQADGKTLILSFRGTELSVTDITEDLDLTLVSFGKELGIRTPEAESWMVMHGWTKTYMSLQLGIFQALARYKGTNTKLVVTGHSLGGALAAVAAMDIALRKELYFEALEDGTPPYFSSIEIATFACPRIGDAGFAAAVDKQFGPAKELTWMVTNFGDQIPHLPPASLGYVHPQLLASVGPHPGQGSHPSPAEFLHNWTVPANPIPFHYIASYMRLIGTLDKSPPLGKLCEAL